MFRIGNAIGTIHRLLKWHRFKAVMLMAQLKARRLLAVAGLVAACGFCVWLGLHAYQLFHPPDRVRIFIEWHSRRNSCIFRRIRF
jgi:hypothetical protein